MLVLVRFSRLENGDVVMAGHGKANGRDQRGRFADGNGGGPGRPPRPIERQYIAVISDVVGLDAWRRVVERALRDAENGDATARAWLSKYVTGDPPQATLFGLAVDAERGRSVEDQIQQAADADRATDQHNAMLRSIFQR